MADRDAELAQFETELAQLRVLYRNWLDGTLDGIMGVMSVSGFRDESAAVPLRKPDMPLFSGLFRVALISCWLPISIRRSVLRRSRPVPGAGQARFAAFLVFGRSAF